jgi:hypothetical protein
VAKQVIADFLSLPITDVTLVSSESKEFNNSSLDCPEPGMSYPQVITAGHQVIVEADGRRFDVRVAGSHGRICHRKGREGQPNLPMKKNAPDHSSPITSQRDQIRDYRS